MKLRGSGTITRHIVSLAATLLIAGAPHSVTADERGEDLAALSKEIQTYEDQLMQIDERRPQLESDLQKAKQSLAAVRKERDKAKAELDRLRADQTQSLQRLRDTERSTEELREHSQRRVRALAMVPQASSGGSLLRMSSIAEADRAAFYFSRVRARDTSLLAQLKEAMMLQAQQQAAIDELVKKSAAGTVVLQDRERALASERQKQEGLVRELAVQQKAAQEALAQLRQRAGQLNGIVASLSGGGLKEQVERKKTEERREEAERPEPAFEGEGLAKLKGSLARPVRGKLQSDFGKRGGTGVRGAIQSKGLEFSTDPGAEVVAIAPGKVIFAGRMPLYGTLVILDHGERYYSLYGRMQETSVSKGDTVERSDRLGQVSEAGPGLLHFEIRKNGAPINPQSFYNKRF